MRKLHLIITALLAGLVLSAQVDCNKLVNYEDGTIWVYQWYSAKGKATYTCHREVVSDAATTSVFITIINALQDTVYNGSFDAHCEAAGLYEGLVGKLTPDMLTSLNNLELETEEDGWMLPHGLSPGDTIAQSYSRIIASQQGEELLQLDLAIGPVNVLEHEDLTTPAGGFACLAMAYELWITSMVRKRFRLRDWLSPGVGIIRREVFDKNGRYFGHCELIAYEVQESSD